MISIKIDSSCLFIYADLIYLMCVRGRCAGEVLRGQGHTGS